MFGLFLRLAIILVGPTLSLPCDGQTHAETAPLAATAHPVSLNQLIFGWLRPDDASIGDSEESEPATDRANARPAVHWHTTRKPVDHQGDIPIHPEVDTMEYRPSDAQPGEFKPRIW